MIGKYKIVHLIGSTKGNSKKFKQAEEYFTKNGYIVFKPVFFNLKPNDPKLEMYNDMCYQKLLVCDIVCLVTPEHIGESTLNRIKQSKELKKEILIFDNNKVISYNQKQNKTNINC